MKKRLLSILICIAAAVSAHAQTVDSGLIDAVTLYSNGQYKQAGKLLKTLSAAAPDSDAVWYYLAQTQLQEQDAEGAQASLEKAVALDSTNFYYRRQLARLYLTRGRTEEGKTLYEGLARDFPDNTTLPYELLDVYLNRKEYEKALDALSDIERLQGPSEEVTSTRFDIYNAMGRPDQGIATLEAFNEQYSSARILSMLGEAYLADFSDSLAQARFQEALDLDGGYVPAVLGMSEVHRHQRRYPEYFRTLQPFFASKDVPAATKSMYIGNMTRSIDPKILQIHRQGFDSLAITAMQVHPADTTLLTTVGTYYFSTGRRETAGTCFRLAASLYPGSLPLTAAYVQYLSLVEDWEQLRQQALQAFGRFHELAFMDYANMANYQLKDHDAIIGNCRYLIKHYPKDRQVLLSAWSQLGDAYYAAGNAKDAFKAYDKALKIDPAHTPVLNNYAYYLSVQGKKLKKAYAMSKKTVEAEPDNATYLDTFAWILHLMGKDLEAKPFFKHAMLYGGKESPVILRHYATVLEALGEADTAKVYHNMAARLDTQEKAQ